MKCIRCGTSIPKISEEATFDELLCDKCYENEIAGKGRLDIVRVWCKHCGDYIGVEGNKVPNFCPTCGKKLIDYDIDGHFVYETLRLESQEEF